LSTLLDEAAASRVPAASPLGLMHADILAQMHVQEWRARHSLLKNHVGWLYN
jgi:hypothetical protein